MAMDFASKPHTSMHPEEPFEFLVQRLAAIPELDVHSARARREYGCDIWIPTAAFEYWRSQLKNVDSPSGLDDAHIQPFYDAAWELARIGVLRPGSFAPRGADMGSGSRLGDGFSITQLGRAWLKDASKRPVVDPSRLSEVLQNFTARFGGGYAQRATEAVRTYRTCNYLAACVMSGAAAESILLALAIAKFGNEPGILQEYKSASGRRRVIRRVVQGVAQPLATQFETLLHVLHYWRDDASHGTMTTISEIEAHFSLSQLLRLAQFASDHWAKLTT